MLLKELVRRENESGCFDLTIDGCCIHSCLAEPLRMAYLEAQGKEQMKNKYGIRGINIVKSFLVSVWQLSRILLFHKN